ncbi:MAG: hypothetical protein JXA89_19275, partial [Anaerolineae bacterium]|nr:hypothetical protein [Anaerolineae bacterium]
VLATALSHVDVPPCVQVEQHIDALPAILADADQLGQVFGNLILNATQAMQSGGRLTIEARQAPALPAFTKPGFMPEHPDAGAEGWIVVSIADTGPGIAPEHLDRLFEPLFTTKAKGMGLGLALVKLLTQANGGGIAIESAPGQGTVFHTCWALRSEEISLAGTR